MKLEEEYFQLSEEINNSTINEDVRVPIEFDSSTKNLIFRIAIAIVGYAAR